MFYVGIDVASQKHDCCILCDDGLYEYFTISNSMNGFNQLAEKLSSPENTRIGLEATGIYGNNLVDFLRRKGFETCTFNPLSIKRLIAANTLRKTKTDKSDAFFIARLISQRDFQPDLPILYQISELKSLCRFRFSLTKERSKLKTLCKTALMIVFPEFISFFSDCFGSTALALLEKYPSAYDIASCRLSAITKTIISVSKGRFNSEDAKRFYDLAKNSVGTYSYSETLKISFYVDQIKAYNVNICAIENKIKDIMSEINSPITTIPGIGVVLGAMIISEIGDIKNFSSPAKLLAFAGLDPSVSQSGKSQSLSGTMVKRGSSYLRWAIIQAARISHLHCPVFSDYLNLKRSQGKHFNVAISHLAKKLIRVIFALLNKNVAFDPCFSS